MSAACPYRCTGMIAFVRGVIAFVTSQGSMLPVLSSQSAKTGVAPAIERPSALKVAVCGGISTSSPAPTPSARMAIWIASVPLLTPMACCTPR